MAIIVLSVIIKATIPIKNVNGVVKNPTYRVIVFAQIVGHTGLYAPNPEQTLCRMGRIFSEPSEIFSNIYNSLF